MGISLKDFDRSEVRVKDLETTLVLWLPLILMNEFSCMLQINDEYSVILDPEDLWLDISVNETQIVQILDGLYHLDDYILNTLLPKNIL